MPGFVNDEIVKVYQKKLEGATGVVLTDLCGMPVATSDEVRSGFFKAEGSFFVVKNRLLKIVLKNKGFEGLDDDCKGMTGVVVLKDEPVAVAKVVRDFEKNIEQFKIKKGYLDGSLLDASDVRELAKIPSREVLLSRLLMCLNSPVSGFVTVLSGLLGKTVRVFDAIREEKEKNAE